ncbi:unnamed protein product [Aphanomyces euteiches]|uniref:MARVEL domain-containing protein n=1 Tax=Aphanomyces euteiches TaxID=100861 RepID=A0A6G0WTF2_9STRA|nr:hypothetical protein Ae201684_011883 [Aphanomyces euteiches]KAH9089297.1 hypothetical protein Ae201684P_001500 [Aphanomyces euteiches]KAH9154784.1 hypothetical protein AeRB84_003174 [Aphanomyces euteiches]
MPSLTALTTYPTNRFVSVRSVVALCSLVSFGCSISATGSSAGDYAFLVSFIGVAYSLEHLYFVMYVQSVSFSRHAQVVLDGLVAALLAGGGIGLSVSDYAEWIGLPDAAIAAIVFLFLSALLQVTAIVFQFVLVAPTEIEAANSQDDVYVASAVLVSPSK